MLLNAKPFVEKKIEELKERIAKLDRIPKLAIIQVEGDSASDKYVGNKQKKCLELGIPVEHYYYYNEDLPWILEEKIACKIGELNNDDSVTGIMLQLPLPDGIDAEFLINQICPYKDVDGLTSYNMGRLAQGKHYAIPPCTPKGIMQLLDYYKIPIEGKDVLIINSSNLVGKPLAQLMLQRGATPTIAHKKTNNLPEKVAKADIVVTAVGIPNFLDDFSLYRGTTVIDVGINFVDGKMCGDVRKDDYESIARRCNLTPVPGGVGQTTVMALLDTLVEMLEK